MCGEDVRGFYGRGRLGDAGGADDWLEFERRLREMLCRQPEEFGLMLRALRALRTGRGEKGKEIAERMRAVLESLGDQILPAE